MGVYKSVSEIEAALRDRSRAEAVVAKVSKGSKGSFDYVPWNETARLLTDIFGTFGWSTRRTGGVEDVERGMYIYDGELIVHALDDETGERLTKTLTGRGFGTVPQTQLQNGDAHDTAAKGARSDFLSVAAKSLGDAFGLYLYDRGDPARGDNAYPSNGNQKAQTSTRTAAKTSDTAHVEGEYGLASTKQAEWLMKKEWTKDEIRAIPDRDQLRAIMDAVFGKGDNPKLAIPPHKATPANVVPMKSKDADNHEVDLDDF